MDVQSLVKKYFFVVNLVLVAIAAYLLARAGNIFVGHFLSPALPKVEQQQGPGKAHKKQGPKRHFASATERNVFAAKREDLVEKVVEEKPQKIRLIRMQKRFQQILISNSSRPPSIFQRNGHWHKFRI